MFLLQFCPSKLKWNHTTFHICHSEAGALRVSVAEDFRLVIAWMTRKTKEAEQIPTVSVDYGFFGHPEDRADDTLLMFIVRDRKRRALMADLDFMVHRGVILKSDQEPSIVALCDSVKNGWHGEIVTEAYPKGESKVNGEVERAAQSVHGLARTSKTSWNNNLESRWSREVRCWLVEHCSNLLLLFHKGEPHDGHTAYVRKKGKPWRVELPSFGECVDCRKRSRHKLESRWSRAVFVGVRIKTTERIVMDETGTHAVQSVRRAPEEKRYDHKLLQKVRGTSWEPNDRRWFDRFA